MKLSRASNAFRNVLTAALTLWFVTALGCANRNCFVCPQCPVSAPISLTLVEVESRTPITLSQIVPSHDGLPLGENLTALRDLTVEQCEQLAAQNSPIAGGLQQEQSLTQSSRFPQDALSNLLDAQAVYQRNVAAGNALEAYLNLVNVYLQHPLLLQSEQEIDRVRRILEKLKENAIDPGFDVREIDRQELTINEQRIELAYNQQRLVTLLEQLLGLQSDVANPIWTNCQLADAEEVYDVQSQYDKALQNRTDIAALEYLASQCDTELLQSMRKAIGGGNPLLGMAIFGGGPIQAFFFRKQDESMELSHRQHQLLHFVEAQKQLLRVEIEQIIASMQRRLAMIESKQQMIASYETSIEEAEKTKDLKKVDLEQEYSNKLKIISTRSELIDEAVGYEIDRVKLKKAQGLLGR